MNGPLDKTFMKILLITFRLDFLIEKELEIFDFGFLIWLNFKWDFWLIINDYGSKCVNREGTAEKTLAHKDFQMFTNFLISVTHSIEGN